MIKSVCTIKGCPNHGRYCRIHPAGEWKEPKKPAQFSKKREEVNKKVYSPLVAEVLKANPNCTVKSPVCTGKAQGLHHLKGRTGELLTDRENVVPCCNPCNQFIEKNDAWARANGWKKSKFSKT